MISKIALNVADFFVYKNVINRDMRDVCVYGLDLILSGIVNLAVIFTAGVLIGRLLTALIFVAIIIPIRMFTGGYHADTHIGCNAVCIVTFLLSVVLLNITEKWSLDMVVWFAMSVSIVVVARLSPIENKNKRIAGETKKKYKFISVIIYSLILIVSVFLNIIGCANDKYMGLEMNTLSLYINITLIIVVCTMVMGKRKEERVKCWKA